MHRLRHEDPLHGHADLAGVHERPAEEDVGHLDRIDVVEDDRRIVAAELEQHALQVRRPRRR